MASFSYGRKVAEGNSNTPLGRYTIEVQDEPLVINGEDMTCYVISYEKSPMQVRVIVDKEKKCKNYIVSSDDLTVMYKCNGEYFGVNQVDPKYSNAGFATDAEKLNKSGFFHQKLITHGMTNEVDAAKLIASFYPELLQN